MYMLVCPILLTILAPAKSVYAFSPLSKSKSKTLTAIVTTTTLHCTNEGLTPKSDVDDANDADDDDGGGGGRSKTYLSTSRRNWARGIMIVVAASTFTPILAQADTDTLIITNEVADITTTTATVTNTPTPLEMKEFVDPSGLFSLRIPKEFFTLRRTQKGDLPNSKTGKGRRGSSIFTAGNMAKAEVVAVERFPTRVLLEENGIEATGDLSTFSAIGNPKAIATLIILRREKDAQNQGKKVVVDSVEAAQDGKELTFRLRTEIDVQNPELLLEQTGVSQLFRITLAKATLNSNDGNMMVIFASALEQDFTNGVDGPALEFSVNSFQAMNQSSS
mmetsp:Transcript_51452/g.57465  ORF Transcript_51452/g.57465 Transcript_51452/m.57465 type:complete len:334 (+) Transcript_51452:114-1115(+)